MTSELVVSYHEQLKQPVERSCAAVRVSRDSTLWLAEDARTPFRVWEEFTPVWAGYSKMGLVLSLTGDEVVCADQDGDEILFPGNERGFQLVVKRSNAAVYLHQRRNQELAHFHDGGSWAWDPGTGGFWYGGLESLVIAPRAYFEARYRLDSEALKRPRARLASTAERAQA